MFLPWVLPIGLILTAGSLLRFALRKAQPYPPLWLFLATWGLGLGIPQLHLSDMELPWSSTYWLLILASLAAYVVGDWVGNRVTQTRVFATISTRLHRTELRSNRLRYFTYTLFLLSVVGLWEMYRTLGTFPLLHPSPDAFRFELDAHIFGGWVYAAQLGRIFVPLCFFLIFSKGFRLRRDYDLVGLIIVGILTQLLFATRTSLFFIDILIMSFYLLLRRPTWRQALEFYPAFLLLAVSVLAAVPLIRQWKSYGVDYLENVTGVHIASENKLGKLLVPIYIGVAFNQQALYHADVYYQRRPIQHGRVTLDIFTHMVGLDRWQPDVDLGDIFYSWWNTGTYLFPFVQDFGRSAFFLIPVLVALVAAWLHRFWLKYPNFLSVWLLSYTYFFLVMSIYLSYTVRPELYLDLVLLIVGYYLATSSQRALQNKAAIQTTDGRRTYH